MKKIFSILLSLFTIAGLLSTAAFYSIAVGLVFGLALKSPVAFIAFSVVFFFMSVFGKANKKMAYMAFTMGICEKLQTSLVEMYKSNAPSLKRSRTGFVDALLSSVNTAGVTKLPLDEGNGKKKKVRVKWIQRACPSQTTTDPFDCTTDRTPEPFEEDVEITQFVRTEGLKFNQSDMRLLCESGAEYRAGVINGQINALMVALDRMLIAAQATEFGEIPNYGAGAKTYNMLKGPEATPIFLGESDLMEDSENMESGEKPIVVGAGNLARYVRAVGIGCCNDSGIDLSKAGNLNYFRDQNVETILGANHFIGMIPGYTQLLTWSENAGEFAMENEVFSNGTMVDPVTGLKIDINWTYDICAKFYQVQLGIHFELYHIPDTAFAACDDLADVNFTFHGIAANISGTGS